MRKILCTAFFFIFSAFAAANDLELLKTLTNSPERLSGKFTQSKYLSKIDISIPSSGDFFYVKDEEIIWQTLKPINSTLKLTP